MSMARAMEPIMVHKIREMSVFSFRALITITHSLHPSVRSYQHTGAITLIHVPTFLKTQQYIWDDESGGYQ